MSYAKANIVTPKVDSLSSYITDKDGIITKETFEKK